MRWSILIATLSRRSEKLQRLLYNDLLPQVERYPDVEVVAYWNHWGERPLGDIRQALVEDAKGDYINFVDDDDYLPEYYCSEIYPFLDGKIDYIGWKMQVIHDGVALKPTFHRLCYGGWYEDETGFYRDVSHLNPVRRELALMADFRRGFPEDESWADQLSLRLKREYFVNRTMYYYHSDSTDCSWKPDSPGARPYSPLDYKRPDIRSDQFRWHPDSSGV